MIRWCSYCQEFVGETAPFDDFSLTHGICPGCASRGFAALAGLVERGTQIAEFYASLRKQAATGELLDVDQTIHEAEVDLGIRSFDLFVGMIQPLLYEVGKLWAEGKVTVAIEHQFTAFAEGILEQMSKRMATKTGLEAPTHAGVLLVCAGGNYHTVGVRALNLALRDAGIASRALFPGLPPRDIVDAVRRFRPRALGVSVSLPTQVPEVQLVLELLRQEPIIRPELIVVGGVASKSPDWTLDGLLGVEPAPNDLQSTVELFRRGVCASGENSQTPSSG